MIKFVEHVSFNVCFFNVYRNTKPAPYIGNETVCLVFLTLQKIYL